MPEAKAKEYTAPDGSFTIPLPKDWGTEARGDQVVLHRGRKAVGAVRITAWRTRGGPAGLDAFLARQEASLAKAVPDESKVLATERFRLEDKRGLFRVSAGEEEGVPVLTTLYLVGGGSTVLLATYVVPAAAYGSPDGKAESDEVVDMLLRSRLR